MNQGTPKCPKCGDQLLLEQTVWELWDLVLVEVEVEGRSLGLQAEIDTCVKSEAAEGRTAVCNNRKCDFRMDEEELIRGATNEEIECE